MNNPATIHAIVKGHVQGVYFRAFAQKHAVSLGLTGCVRNLPSGDVEVLAEGEPEKLAELVKQLRSGTPYSRVTDVVVEWQEYTGKFKKFQINYF